MCDIVAHRKDSPFIRNSAKAKFTKLCIYRCGINGEEICKFWRDAERILNYFLGYILCFGAYVHK